jgi:SAM-dependent methyltransferase
MHKPRPEVAMFDPSGYARPMRHPLLAASSTVIFTALLCACGPTPERPDPPPTDPQAAHYLDRPIAPSLPAAEADPLVRPERAAEERVDLLYQALGLSPGKTACDVGAGNGYHTIELARKVYPGGRVLATDTQPAMLDRLATREAETRATGGAMVPIERIVGEPTDAKLPAGGCDLILLVDAYHEFSHPAAMLDALRVALAIDGRLAVVEFRAEDPEVTGDPAHKMSKEQMHREFSAHGFTLVGQLDALPRQHALFYGRDDGPRGAVTLRAWRPRTTPTAPFVEPVERPSDISDGE